MKQFFYIKNLCDEKYYCSFPDGFTREILDAVKFDSYDEAARRIEEIALIWQRLTIINTIEKQS